MLSTMLMRRTCRRITKQTTTVNSMVSAIINVITGKAKEKKISPLMYVLTVLFILKYVFL